MLFQILLYVCLLNACKAFEKDLSALQLVQYKNQHDVPVGKLTLSTGRLVTVNSTSVLSDSKIVLNRFFMDTLLHLVRERIPERHVHAKGAGAFGYFKVTHDVTDICRADFLSHVGKTTPIITRFSTVNGRAGSIDTARDVRGYAIKFYTQQGIYDLLTLSTPMFSLKDPAVFPFFTHSQKLNPKTNLFDFGMRWDYRTYQTESLFSALYTASDFGIFDGFRKMPGFAIHTFQVENNKGVPSFVRFHLLPDLGNKTLTTEEAQEIGGKDPDYSTRDLYNAIEAGNFPSWTMYFQVLTMDDIKSVDFDPFDVTRIIPTDQFPLRPVGTIVLNKNPINFFSEVEQLAFNPTNLVPGIVGAPDKLFEGRAPAYSAAQSYRLSENFNKIAVNCPIHSLTYERDGESPVKRNNYDIPNYYPNSFSGPKPVQDLIGQPLINVVTDGKATNLEQASAFYDNLDEDHKDRLVEGITSEILCIPKIVQERVVNTLTDINEDLGEKLKTQLQNDTSCAECAKY